MNSIKLFDTTLRDGAQAEGVSYSTHDKLQIAQALDRLGIHYIEGGWPGSNPKDNQFFKDARSIDLKKARLVAFGSTRRKGVRAAQDANLGAIVDSQVPVACIFGKSWDMQVTHALRTTLEENLAMIRESVAYLKSKRLEVIYDAEHFFDGFRSNRPYALRTLQAALEAGADNLTLCDTNGGSLPSQITDAFRVVRRVLPKAAWGIHVHNDSGCAVANTLAAVEAGATLVQGTMNGIGERCGNADLSVIIPNIQLKLGKRVLNDAQLRSLTEVSRSISEITNLVPNDRQPYVGNSAFAHKGGIHVSAVSRHAPTYEHIDPVTVGNQRRVLVSELSGKSNVILKAKEHTLDFVKNGKVTQAILDALKKRESEGYHYEGAEASFELLVEKALKRYKPSFELGGFRVVVERKAGDSRALVTEATLKIKVNGREEHTVAEGDGPVNALDNALRKALEKFYPALKEMSLVDYKVRVINAAAGTAAKVRVLIESMDGKDEWTTTGVSMNLIEASWTALVDAIEYKLLKDSVKPSHKVK
ncbi:MAG: citramalate synthase [Elusimicrobia bacterium RIFCSPLOWO2_01_FULL_59_12]|nr:MAG: citramalate synthase [Elusimicrobia bacterium RIFCSPLOWO2_01_FULL_59_12]